MVLCALLTTASSTASADYPDRTPPLTVDRAAARGTCSPDGWCWQYPTPCGDTLHALWGASPDDGWAAGDSGHILHWDGDDWTPVSSGTGSNLLALWGADADHVWAVGRGGTLLRWDGARWAAEKVHTQADLYAVHGRADDDVWVAGGGGTLLHFDGRRWSTIATGSRLRFVAVAAAPDGDVWLAGEDTSEVGLRGHLCRARNGTCEPHEMPPAGDFTNDLISDLQIGPDGRLWVVQAALPNLAILAGDGTWERVRLSGRSYLGALDFAPDGDAWFAGHGGVMWQGALGWTAPQMPLQDALHAIWVPGPCAEPTPGECLVWMAGERGALMSYDGQDWRRAGLLDGPGVQTLYRDPGGVLWAGGADGQFRRYDAQMWIPWMLGNHRIVGMWAAAGDDLWAIGHSRGDAMANGQSALYHFDGSRFAPPEYLDGWRFTGIWGTAADDLWTVATEDHFSAENVPPLIRRFDGQRWKDVPLPADLGVTGVAGIWGSADDDVWLLSGRRALRFDGADWSALEMPRQVSLHAAWGSSADDVWLLGEHALFHWDGAKAEEHRHVLLGSGIRLNAIHGSGQDDVWIAAEKGRALHYDGETWTLTDTGTAAHLTAVLAEPDRTWLGTWDGGLLMREGD